MKGYEAIELEIVKIETDNVIATSPYNSGTDTPIIPIIDITDTLLS